MPAARHEPSAPITDARQDKLRNGLIVWIQRDGIVILLYALVTMAMTFPLIIRLGGSWVPAPGRDVLGKLWDIWWFGSRVLRGNPLYSTDDLFYPVGLDLSFHSISWTVASLSWLISPIVGILSAHKILILAGVFATAYGGYLLIRTLVAQRMAAWLGGAIYSFSPYIIAHSGQHPDIAQIASIPITVLLLTLALSRSNMWAAASAGLMLGITAWTGYYLMGFAIITLVPLSAFIALQNANWRKLRFWQAAAVFGIVSAVVLGPRLVPIFRNGANLAVVIAQRYQPDRRTDLLAYVASPGAKLALDSIAPDFSRKLGAIPVWPPYLGAIPIVLSLSTLMWNRHRRETWQWLAIGLMFAIMSLGPSLRFNGKDFVSIRLPFSYLQWLPLVRAVEPGFYHVGLLLPLAVLSAYGLEHWLLRLGHRNSLSILLAIGLSSLLLLEYWNGQYPLIERPVSTFYTQIANEEGDFAIIELPMGRSESKEYEHFQSIHHRPIVEGYSARTLPISYQYIDQNLLLSQWRTGAELDCASIPGAEPSDGPECVDC